MAFGLAEAAKLAVDLSLKGNFASSLATSQKALKTFDGQVSTTSTRAYRAGQQIGTGIKSGAIIAAGGVAFLASQVALGLASLSRLDDVVAQTNAVLKSTKGAAGENAAAIRDLANKYEDLNATIDDTVIQSGENLLLTFTNIRQKAFEPTLKAALDMNQALGRGESGLTDTVRILGKALNDPAKGLTALQRVGVVFTKTQKEQIAAALKSNDTFGAQSIILDELNKRFGGSFLAGGQTTTGKIAKFKDAIDDLQRTLASALLPTIGKVADRLSTFLKNPAVIAQVSKLGDAIASLFSDQNLAEGGKILSSVFDTAKAAAPILVSTVQATLGIVKAAVGLFQSLPAPLQQLAVGAFAVNKLTGGLVTNIAGGLASILSNIIKSKVVNVAGAVVNVSGGIPGVPGGGLPVAGLPIIPIAAAFLAIVGAPFYTQWLAEHGFGTSPGAGNPGATNAPGGGLPPGVHTGSRTPNLPGFGQFTPGSGLPVNVVAVGGGLPTGFLDRGGRGQGQAGRAADDIVSLANLQRSTLDFLHDQFHEAFRDLKQAKTGAQIKAAIEAINKSIFGKGIGGSGGAGATEKTLRGLLAKTDDPKLQQVLKTEIGKVHSKMLGRQFEEGEFRKFDKVWKSSEGNKQKIADLQKIAKDVGAKDRANGAKLQAKVDALKKGLSTSISATTQAVKDKDLSVKLTNNISVPVSVNSRSVAISNFHYSRYFGGNAG